ncbi:Carbon starvation induced regulator [Raoultella terrigena]|nr:Carbon starvation induced regulator [Raoultella terrigena]
MTATSQPTAIDGYRWLKSDIIRGLYQPDEKLRMSLLTARYALGVGPLREALSRLVAERLVTVVNQKRLSGCLDVAAGAARYLRRQGSYGGDAGASRH